VLRFFSGLLLDSNSLELEQQYLRDTSRRRHRAAAVWLELDEGHAFEGWHERASLQDCDADDRCFQLDREAAVIRFGDGEHGHRPAPGARVRGWYRSGSGDAGNVPGSPSAISRADLVSLLAEVSHLTWMRQAACDKGFCYQQLDPTATDHDRERAEETIAELERLGLLRPEHLPG
jgi:hypothetical protein